MFLALFDLPAAMIMVSAKAIEIKSFSVTLNMTHYAIRLKPSWPLSLPKGDKLRNKAIRNTQYAIRNTCYLRSGRNDD